MRYTPTELDEIRDLALAEMATRRAEAERHLKRPLAYGECFCGCGQQAPRAYKTRRHLGHAKGEPIAYLPGHQGTKPRARRGYRPRFTPPEQARREQAIRVEVERLRARAEVDLQRLVPIGECLCGCGETTDVARQTIDDFLQIKGEPKPYIRGHGRHSTRIHRTRYRVEDRGYKTPCWIWQGAKTIDGYGKLGVEGAHRMFYRETRGEIPTGWTIDHLCRVITCVNPEHLEAVTNGENIRRRSKINWQQVAEIRRHANERPRQPHIIRLAALYNVAPRTVKDIMLGKTWPESERPHAPPL